MSYGTNTVWLCFVCFASSESCEYSECFDYFACSDFLEYFECIMNSDSINIFNRRQMLLRKENCCSTQGPAARLMHLCSYAEAALNTMFGSSLCLYNISKYLSFYLTNIDELCVDELLSSIAIQFWSQGRDFKFRPNQEYIIVTSQGSTQKLVFLGVFPK